MELDRIVGKREENSILRESSEELASFAFSPYMLWEWGCPGDIPLRSKGAAFSPSPFWTCLSLLLQRVPAEEITYETLKKAIGKTAAQETLRSREVGADMDLVASWNSAAPKLQLEVPSPWSGGGTAYHCVSSLCITHPLSAFNDNYLWKFPLEG